jgi:hypothetical protein
MGDSTDSSSSSSLHHRAGASTRPVNSRPKLDDDTLASDELIPSTVLEDEEMDEGGEGSTHVAWEGSNVTPAHIN